MLWTKRQALQMVSHLLHNNPLSNRWFPVAFWVARSSLSFKRETPWTVAWSADGSLLAVAFGAYVVIYDPSSNALIRAFTTSELRGPVRVVHFLGNEGRFLAVAGRTDVVLWDLVTQKGKLSTHLPVVLVQ
jgi:hypothetical protein